MTDLCHLRKKQTKTTSRYIVELLILLLILRLLLIVRLKDRLQPNIGFILFWRCSHVRYNSAASEPIWITSGAHILHCQALALADYVRDPQ